VGWGSFAGLKKEYKLFKRVRGTATFLYNLYNPDYKSPYSDQINMRFGFEFPMKKRLRRIKNRVPPIKVSKQAVFKPLGLPTFLDHLKISSRIGQGGRLRPP
jgi:hypothetical protein